MRYRVLLLFFLGLTTYSVLLASEENSIEYVGSFSKLRFSSEHVSIHEVWLWRHDENVVGLYLNKAGLQDEQLPVLMHKIRQGRLASDGSLTFETKWYQFQDDYLGGSIEGKLVQSSEVIWGGIEGSDKIEFVRGSNVKSIKNPAHDIKRFIDLDKWINALPGIQ